MEGKKGGTDAKEPPREGKSGKGAGDAKEPPKEGKKPGEDEVSRSTGRVIVRLPAEAKLFVDGVACPLTSATRSFNTPTLEQGRQYYYTLRVEVTRNGEVQSDSKRVIVQAGREATVDFGDLRSVQTASR